MSEPIIGIDLGTTNSEVAVVIGGRVEVVEQNGNPILPSYVGLDGDGQLLVGHEARNQYALRPESTIRSIKRKMGSPEPVSLGSREYLPQEISAMILRRLKQWAEERLGTPVHKAVITVPAQFSDAQRQATRDAGAIAGLEVVRILNEPTAACLAYQGAVSDQARRILAFDLGGGTFDVSIVQAEGDVVEVITSHGNNQLGGDDIDEALAGWLNTQLAEQQERPEPLARTARRRITRAAETAKIHLSEHSFAKILESHLKTESGGELALDVELHRHQFEEEVLRPILEQTLPAVHQALADASLKPRDIDEIILVGGSTRIPALQHLLADELGHRPRRDVHPELAVAYGAGVMAARLMGQTEQRILVDITPYTFGTSCLGYLGHEYGPHKFVAVIEAGTPLPLRREESFCTVYDDQDAVEMRIFQGESEDARENILVGSFRVTGLSEGPAGNEIVLAMALDLDGILRVTASEKATGLHKSIQIKDAMATLTPEQIAQSQASIRELFGDDDLEQEDAPLAETEPISDLQAEAGAIVDRVAKVRAGMSKVDQQDADALLGRLQQALDGQDAEAAASILTELDDLLFYVEVD